jgi:hypothetical protein
MTNVNESWKAIMTPEAKRAYIDSVRDEYWPNIGTEWDRIFNMKTKEEWLKEYVPGRVEDLIDAMMAESHYALFGELKLKVKMTGIVSDGPLSEVTGEMNATDQGDSIDPIPLPDMQSSPFALKEGRKYVDSQGKIWIFQHSRLESA